MNYKFKALVYDDIDACRELLVELLENRGYLVQSYPDVSTHPLFSDITPHCQESTACPDFLLIDNRMPYMTGLNFLERQKNCDSCLSQTRNAIFSGSWTVEELRKAEQLGCRVFHKPYSFEAVEDWLNEQEILIISSKGAAEPTVL